MSATFVKMLADVAAQRDRLRVALEELISDDTTPEPNCSCHISPPCGDCFEHAHRRELISFAKAALARCTPIDGMLDELARPMALDVAAADTDEQRPNAAGDADDWTDRALRVQRAP